MRTRVLTAFLGSVALCFALTGCGASTPRSEISGKLLLDGKPLVGAQVQLLPKGEGNLGMHSATTDDEGVFIIVEKAGSNNPIQPGKYVVLVSKFEVPEGKADQPGAGMGGMVNTLPNVYQDRTTSPLGIEVKTADTKVRLKLTTQVKEPAPKAGT